MSEQERIEQEAIEYEDKNPYDAIHSAYYMGANATRLRYIQALKELIPIAERMQAACESGETFDYGNEHDFRDSQKYQSAIERAKSLLP